MFKFLTPVMRGKTHNSVLSLSMKKSNYFTPMSLAICDFNTIAFKNIFCELVARYTFALTL